MIDFVVMLTPKAEMDESKTGPSDPANVLSARKLTAVRPNIEGVAMARRLVLPFDDRQTFYRAG